MSSALLQVENLKKYFATPRGMLHAVDDVSFSINANETFGIVGESGCGKSTLGRTVLRLQEPTAGKVLYKGNDISAYNGAKLKELRRHMQIIFQDPFASLNPRLSVSETILEPLMIHKMNTSGYRAQAKKKVRELMDLVGLAQRLGNAYPHELDGGRRQRIGIARALALEPDFVVCDEPVSALDVSIQAQILNLLQDLQQQRGLTYIFITHDLSVVRHISDTIAVMYLGEIIEKTSGKQLFARPMHPYTQALLSAIPIPDPDVDSKRIMLKGELSSPIEPEATCRFAPRCPAKQLICDQQPAPLVDAGDGHIVKCHLCRGCAVSAQTGITQDKEGAS